MEEDRRAGHHAGFGAPGQLTSPLAALADAYGVASAYEGADGRRRAVPDTTVRAALGAMGVACAGAADVERSLAEAREAPWRRTVPACTVLRVSEPPRVGLRLPPGRRIDAQVLTEDGADVPVPAAPRPDGAPRTLSDGTVRAACTLELPALPCGYHQLTVSPAGDPAQASTGHVVVVPDRCPDPAALGPVWGFQAQLYALRSARSWGIGDLEDLAALLEWGAGLGADFAVVNPLHAAAPVLPRQDSPYYPSSRRFSDPLALAVDRVPEVRRLDGAAAEHVATIAQTARAANDHDRIDRDAAFRAQDQALRRAFASRDRRRDRELAAFRQRHGQALEDFATFCALAEDHGTPFRTWPAELRSPTSPAVVAFRGGNPERIAYHAWLQLLCDEQLAAAQRRATDAGARIGVVHDLAVGVDPGGADAWALQNELATGVTVGAPPDAFNPHGQDWGQPPLLPHRLAETGFAPFREMLRATLRHAGGLRIDHAAGLFRLYWIAEGAAADEGTYVRYPAAALLGVLALEAERAGAVVVGEDLGTVEEGVSETLADRGVLTSAVLYFEQDEHGAPRPARSYPRRALASASTHDLPTAAAWWTGQDLRLREGLGLLSPGELDEERRRRAQLRELLDREGLLGDEPSTLDAVTALHAFLARTPALLVAVSLSDLVGDLRQPNLPGTTEDYPNWRLPLAEPHGDGHRPVPLERLREHPGVQAWLSALQGSGRPAAPTP